MKQLKFKNYNNGFVRAYFKHDKTLYCVQAGYNYLPEFLICSRDGEPSHPVEDTHKYRFTNLPPDGDTWSWAEIVAFFTCKAITNNGQLTKRMNDLFQVNE